MSVGFDRRDARDACSDRRDAKDACSDRRDARDACSDRREARDACSDKREARDACSDRREARDACSDRVGTRAKTENFYRWSEYFGPELDVQLCTWTSASGALPLSKLLCHSLGKVNIIAQSAHCVVGIHKS